MKSVVMIAHCFPPEGSAGTYRPLRFVRHLPSFGWQPTVIADDPYDYERYDPKLMDLVPSSTEIIRVRNPDPWNRIQQYRQRRFKEATDKVSIETRAQASSSHQRLARSMVREAVHKLESMVYRPDPAMGWIRPGTRAVIEASGRNGSQVIWVTGSPWSSFVVAQKVYRRTGLPYILDLRDAWTLSQADFQQRQPDWVRARDRKLLSGFFRGAKAVVLRYMSEAEAYWRAYPGALDPERVHLIPNGFDGALAPFEVSPGDRCTILYTGTVVEYWYDGILEALTRMKQLYPEDARRLRLVFVGEGMEALASKAASCGLSDVIETRDQVPFAEANQLQQQAHALLLLGWRPARGHELGGSKIFGYLKARRPIVGILPQDENARILRSVGVQTLADAGSPREILETFRQVLRAWSTGQLESLLPDRAACERYSAERQTRALVCALEGLPAEEPFRPGTSRVPPSLEKVIPEQGWVLSV